MSLYRRLHEVRARPGRGPGAPGPGARRAPPAGAPPPHRRGRPAALRPPGRPGRAAPPASRSSSWSSSAGRRCRCRASTGRSSSRTSSTTSSATARSTGSSTTRTSPRSWSTGPSGSTSSASGKIDAVRGHVPRRGPPPADHREDRGPGRPAGRRGDADGRRPPARRLPGQRHHLARWPSAARSSRSGSSPPTPTRSRT